MDLLGITCRVSHLAKISGAEPCRQKRDRRHAALLLELHHPVTAVRESRPTNRSRVGRADGHRKFTALRADYHHCGFDDPE
jgi:hypothetical protein